MSKDNGGPAFPACNEANVNDTMGMSLRDYMAIHASEKDVDRVMERHISQDYIDAELEYFRKMPARGLSVPFYSPKTYSITRQQARYIFADEMIAERNK